MSDLPLVREDGLVAEWGLYLRHLAFASLIHRQPTSPYFLTSLERSSSSLFLTCFSNTYNSFRNPRLPFQSSGNSHAEDQSFEVLLVIFAKLLYHGSKDSRAIPFQR
jgi:hypothetical protein